MKKGYIYIYIYIYKSQTISNIVNFFAMYHYVFFWNVSLYLANIYYIVGP